MTLPKRHGSTDVYRYGFQGQEKDDEVKGEGNSYNYKYRMHDPRIGRFFAVDPLASKYPYLTPYQFSSNTPIMAVELEGLESSEQPNENESMNLGVTDPNNHCSDTDCSTVSTPKTLPYQGGIKPFEVADYNGEVPYGSSKLENNFDYKGYTFVSNYITNLTGEEEFSHFTVGTLITDLNAPGGKSFRTDYIVGLKDVGNFLNNIKNFSIAANLMYGGGRYLSKWQIDILNKNYSSGVGNYLISEWTNPYKLVAAASMFAAARPRANIKTTGRTYNLSAANEFDPMVTLYRGKTGSEGAGSMIFLTDDITVARMYVKNGEQVMKYEISSSSLWEMGVRGEVTTLKDSYQGVQHNTFRFNNSQIREALNNIEKPID